MKITSTPPRIYVACLAAYNAGILHGEWINATQEPDQIWSGIRNILQSSPIANAEEYAIHDYEGFEGIGLSEYSGMEEAHQLACFVEEHGKLGTEVLDYYGGDLDTTVELLTHGYAGEYSSLAEFAESFINETVNIPNEIAYYIDYSRIGRDMELGGGILTVGTAYDEVHVFFES